MDRMTQHLNVARICVAVVGLGLAALSGRAGIFVAGDYNGDTLDDLAVYEEATGVWSIRTLPGTALATGLAWGGPGFTAVAGDFDGDAISDLAVYNATSGQWFIRTLAGQTLASGLSWGGPGLVAVPGDYDGDGLADLALYNQSTGTWYVRTLAGETLASGNAWGGAGLTAVPGDYDGDSRSDCAVYDAASGRWYIMSANGTLIGSGLAWGGAGLMPVPGDFDGDGAADLALCDTARGLWSVYSVEKATTLASGQAASDGGYAVAASDLDGDFKADSISYDTANGVWAIRLSRSGYARLDLRGFPSASSASPVMAACGAATPAGQCLDLTYAPTPVAFDQGGLVGLVGDYDGDGLDDVGAYEAASGRWGIVLSATQNTIEKDFGGPGLEPLTGDFDGDGVTDFAVFMRANAMWFIACSQGNMIALPWGSSTCIPVPKDYDGDGVTDVAVYLPETGDWWAICSGTGEIVSARWGWSGATPVPADYDGDGRADPAVFWAEQGRWYIQLSSGGTVMGQPGGWNGCIPVAADFDGDSKADIAAYWPAGNCWLAYCSSNGLSVFGHWTNTAALAGADAQAFLGRFDKEGGLRLAVFDRAFGCMYQQPAVPCFVSQLNSVEMSLARLKNTLIANPPALRKNAASASRAVGVVLEIVESVIELYEEEEQAESIDLIHSKLDDVKTSLDTITVKLDNLMKVITYTRDELKQNIWQAQLSDAIIDITGTFDDLRAFNRNSYTYTSPGTRKALTANFLRHYDARDIEGRMTKIHTYITGQGLSIPSSFDNWANTLVNKVKDGADLGSAYSMLENYFTEQLTYQYQGAQLIGHVDLYRYGRTTDVFTIYVVDTLAPRITQQVAKYMAAVDRLVAAGMAWDSELASRPPVLPTVVADIYRRSDFLASALSLNCPWGLWIHVIGEPDTVQQYANAGSYTYSGSNVPSTALPLVSIDNQRVRLYDSKAPYYTWNWYNEGSYNGYSKFKRSTSIASAFGVVTNAPVGQYALYAPWAGNANARGCGHADYGKYDYAMNRVADTDTNGVMFGSAVMFIRNYPVWQDGGSSEYANYYMGSYCFSFPVSMNPSIGDVFITKKTMTHCDSPWYLVSPSRSGQTTQYMYLYNDDADGRALRLDYKLEMNFNCSGGGLRTSGFPEARAIIQLGGASAGVVESTYGNYTFTNILNADAGANAAIHLYFKVEQYSQWPGGNSFWANTYEELRVKLAHMQWY